jgi:hypothetical protein
MWAVAVERGLHQCIHCQQVITSKDLTPRFEDLPLEFQRRWAAHEKDAQPPAVPAPAPPRAPPASPAAPAKATAPAAAPAAPLASGEPEP